MTKVVFRILEVLKNKIRGVIPLFNPFYVVDFDKNDFLGMQLQNGDLIYIEIEVGETLQITKSRILEKIE